MCRLPMVIVSAVMKCSGDVSSADGHRFCGDEMADQAERRPQRAS
jgi:hypothetical protein